MSTQFTAADVQLVTAAINDASGYSYADDAEGWAPYVLRALAEAGRLQPDGAERQWGTRSAWVEKDFALIHRYTTREEAVANLDNASDLVTRVVGPWVEADEDGTP